MIKIIQKIILVLVFVLPFFVITRTFYPMVYPKSLLFEFTTLVILAMWLISRILNKNNENISIGLPIFVFILYVLFDLISGLNGVVPGLSFWGAMDHGMGTIFMICLLLFAFVVNNVFKKIEDWFSLFTVFVSSGILFTFFSLTTFLGVTFSNVLTINSIGGFTIGNSSWTGLYMTFVFFIALGLAFSGKNRTQKIIGITGVVTAFFDPILTGFLYQAPGASFGFIGLARAGSYSMLFGIGLFSLYILFRHITLNKWKKIFLVSILSLFIVTSFSVFLFGADSIRNSIAENAGPNRFVFWGIAMEGFKEKPILGWGSETYQYVYGKYFDPIITQPPYAPEFWVDRSHNIYFDELIEGGIVGFILLSCLYLLLLFGLFKKASLYIDEKEGFIYMALFAGILSFLIQGLMIFQNSIGWFIITLLLVFVSSFCFTYVYNFKLSEKIFSVIYRIRFVLISIILVLFFILFNYVIVIPYQINRELAMLPTAPYSDRFRFYKDINDSYLGNYSDLGNNFSRYHLRLRKFAYDGLDKNQKKDMLIEIRELGAVIDNSLKKQDYMDVKLLMSGGGMMSVGVAIAPDSEKDFFYKKGLSYVGKMNDMSSLNPMNRVTHLFLDYALDYGEKGLNVVDLSNVK